MEETKEYQNLVVGTRKCRCGERYDFACFNDKCKECCQDEPCQYHAVLLLREKITTKQCLCGNSRRRDCKFEKCGICCNDLTCQPHYHQIIAREQRNNNNMISINGCSSEKQNNGVCRNIMCQKHRVSIIQQVKNNINCPCNDGYETLISPVCTNRLCGNCCRIRGLRDCVKHNVNGIAPHKKFNSEMKCNICNFGYTTRRGRNLSLKYVYSCDYCNIDFCNVCNPARTLDIMCMDKNCRKCNCNDNDDPHHYIDGDHEKCIEKMCDDIIVHGYYCGMCYNTIMEKRKNINCTMCNTKLSYNSNKYWKCDECDHIICNKCIKISGKHQTKLCEEKDCYLCRTKSYYDSISYNHCGSCYQKILISFDISNGFTSCLIKSFCSNKYNPLKVRDAKFECLSRGKFKQIYSKCNNKELFGKCMDKICDICCDNIICPEHNEKNIQKLWNIQNGKCACGTHFDEKCADKLCFNCCTHKSYKCDFHAQILLDINYDLICDNCGIKSYNINGFGCTGCKKNFCNICKSHYRRDHIKCKNKKCWYCKQSRLGNTQHSFVNYCIDCWHKNDIHELYHNECCNCNTKLYATSFNTDDEKINDILYLKCSICDRKTCYECNVVSSRHRIIEYENNMYCNKCFQQNNETQDDENKSDSSYDSDYTSESDSDITESSHSSDFGSDFSTDSEKEENIEEKHSVIIKYVHDKDYVELEKKFNIKITKVEGIKILYDDNKECPICYGDIQCQINCGHTFCVECHIKERLTKSNKCAVCRKKFNNKLTVMI